MENSKFETILAVVAGFLILFLLIDNDKKKKQIISLKKEIEDNENITKEIKKKLTELIQNNPEIDQKIAAELGQTVALLEIKQNTTAVFKLAKIIENLLKEFYYEDAGLKKLSEKNGRKTPVFADYLEYARDKKILTNEDFHLLSILKIIRNEEAHDLDVRKENSKIIAVFISGINFILGLCKRLDKKSLDQSIL